MNQEKIQSSIYPEKQMPYTVWCKKFKVGSRVQKYTTKNFYKDGEYDYEKFIKMIQNYGADKKQRSSMWSESLDRLRNLLAI